MVDTPMKRYDLINEVGLKLYLIATLLKTYPCLVGECKRNVCYVQSGVATYAGPRIWSYHQHVSSNPLLYAER